MADPVDQVEHIAFLGDLYCGGCRSRLVIINKRLGHVACQNGPCSAHGLTFYWPNVVLEIVEVDPETQLPK